MSDEKLDKPITPLEQLLINSTTMCNDLKDIKRDNMKQFGGLIGVIMALIGSKLIDTPWYVDTAVILSLVAGGVLGASLVSWWKFFKWPQRALRITSVILLLASSGTQIFIYRPGIEVAPPWFTPMINGCMILLAVTMIWAGWSLVPKNKEGATSCR
jgi:hypothetical protein